jgi:diaminopimelate epimerase
MRFTKLHGLGNDFLVVSEDAAPDAARAGELARRICERHTGIGADGLLLLSLEAPARDEAGFRVFNADGSQAEISGNGLRCALAWLAHHKKIGGRRVVFRTAAGKRTGDIIASSGTLYEVRMEMGTPRLRPEEIPFDDGRTRDRVLDYPMPIGQKVYEITGLSMGNPHCSIFVDHFPARIEWHQIGREIESHPFFPKRTNVEFIRVLDRGEIEVLFWERGVGETLSSGTGSSAAAVASMLKGLTDRTVKVRTSMGGLTVEWAADGQVYQTGPAEVVFEGEYPAC